MTRNVRRRRDRRDCWGLRVWLDGREVTNRCTYFDVRRGVVRLFLHDLQGNVVVHPDRRGVVHYQRRGRVVVRARTVRAETR